MHTMNAALAKMALAFALNLGNGNFVAAHQMLTGAYAQQVSVQQLGAKYQSMIAYGSGPVNDVKVQDTMEAWPDKRPGDIGVAYVSMMGDGFSEAVTLFICDDRGRQAIREIYWGRP